MHTSILILLIILIPFITAIIVGFINSFTLRSIVLISSSLISLGLIILLLCSYFYYGIFIENFNVIHCVENIYLAFQIEPCALLFASLISILWPTTLLYTLNYMQFLNKYKNVLDSKAFYSYFCASIGATLGLAFSGNLITTFIFYESLTLLTYPLITFDKSPEAIKSGNYYLIILLGTSMLFFLPAIILVWLNTGTVTYTMQGLFFSGSYGKILFIFLLFIAGVSKMAIMPFHSWLPRAMVAPSPVSALLHAVAVVKSGIFVILKVTVYIFGIKYLHQAIDKIFHFNALLIIPSVTILIASLLNLFQPSFKKMLAYSTIAQLSYILCCIFLLNKVGILAAGIYFVAHALAKIVLFFQAGNSVLFAGSDNIEDLGGIGRATHQPLSTTIGAFNMFSILNLPFTLGFIAKFYLIKAVIESHCYWILGVFTVSYLFNVIYFSRVLYRFYFAPSTILQHIVLDLDNDKSTPFIYMTLIMLFITMLNIFLFFGYDSILRLIQGALLGL